jgi:nucleoside-diphosphate-sugar epimerase
MKILVTGASGFIGGFLVEEALHKGWEVWAGVRKTSDRRYLTHPDLHFIDLNYADEAALTMQIKKHTAEHGAWDYIIHNAGITKTVDEADYHRINHLYTVQLLHALQKSGKTPAKFIFMSSMGAVGPGKDSGEPLTMSDQPSPISEYGRSKLLAEEFIRTLTDFPWIILRPTGVYGPRERDYFVLLKMIKAGLNISVGLKQKLLNFIYISDLVRVTFLALESRLTQQTWFVADGDLYTSDEYSSILQNVLHKKNVLNLRIPLSVVKGVSILSEIYSRLTKRPTLLNADKYKVMKQRNWTCDASALENDLNFKPEFNLRTGMEITVAWSMENGWL